MGVFLKKHRMAFTLPGCCAALTLLYMAAFSGVSAEGVRDALLRYGDLAPVIYRRAAVRTAVGQRIYFHRRGNKLCADVLPGAPHRPGKDTGAGTKETAFGMAGPAEKGRRAERLPAADNTAPDTGGAL